MFILNYILFPFIFIEKFLIIFLPNNIYLSYKRYHLYIKNITYISYKYYIIIELSNYQII